MSQSTTAIDCYKVLQIQFGAEKSDIITSYRKLCKLYHPDVNNDPGVKDLMKQINMAYYVLRDDLRRAAYNSTYMLKYSRPPSPRPDRQGGSGRRAGAGAVSGAGSDAVSAAAFEVIKEYFAALVSGTYDKAYYLLSAYDRQYVTLQSFCKWRTSVNKLFSMREFSARSTDPVSSLTLEDGSSVPAIKHYISITEKNNATQATERYQMAKFTLSEGGKWRVYLGYRDLNDIAKMFENLSAEQEKSEMAKHWEQYCTNMCRALDMLSLQGLLKESKRELYRCNRYNQALTVAVFKIGFADKPFSEELAADLLESAAKTINSTLRETDLPAYIGGGRFTILFFELKRKHASVIIERLSDRLRKDAKERLRENVTVAQDYTIYTGGQLTPYIESLSEKVSK